MEFALIIPAFIAGLLTFLAPCTLPLVPGYLGFISGVSAGEAGFFGEEERKRIRRKVFLNGIAYVIGFSIVFVVFGTLAGLFGSAIGPYRIWFTRIGGILVILFGLMMLGVFRYSIFRTETALKVGSGKKGKPFNSLLLGSAFAFGWTPCVGPILGSVLLLTTSKASALSGAFLLGIFSLGLAIPFLAVAWGFGRAAKYIGRFSKHLKYITIIGGLLLVFLGILLFFDKMGLLVAWGFQYLDFLEYEKIQEYL